MRAEKVQVKVFSKTAAEVEAYVPVFHRWIRERVLDELLIDVVDYSHVHNGPEVVLIGHAGDYALDRADGKLGLLYVSKREPATSEGPFLPALRRAFFAGALLEKEAGVPRPFSFKADQLVMRIADRLSAPNTDESFRRFEAPLRSALELLYGGTAFQVRRLGSPRDLFTVEVQAESNASLSDLLPRLQGP